MNAQKEGRNTSSCGTFRGKDISGQRFGCLTALYPLKARSKKRSVIWRCRCDCGREKDCSYNALLYSALKSCGCARKANHRALPGYPDRVDGTALDRLKSDKRQENNTSGVKGVYLIRGKYVAKMVFQKKQIYLGTYDSLEEAAQARMAAADLVRRHVLPRYARWKERAQRDEQWAKEHPVRMDVHKDAEGKLIILFSPEMQ